MSSEKMRLLNDAKTSVAEANRLVQSVDIASDLSDDVYRIISAANQCSQAVKELSTLVGFIRCEKQESK